MIKKIFEKIRYYLISRLIKYITPNLYHKIQILDLIGYNVKLNVNGYNSRPSLEIMKETFSNKYVNGVEIGVNNGINSEHILKKLNIEKLYLVDIWQAYKSYTLYLETSNNSYLQVLHKFKNKENVEIIKNFSHIAVNDFKDKSLDFVYIDGNHSYEYVYNDIELWSKKIKTNGIIAGHDIFNIPDVLNAVKDWCMRNKTIFYIKIPDWYFFKN